MPDSPPLVLVLVGTDFHPFDRLVGWTDAWYSQQPSGAVECLIQHGATKPPRHAPGRDFWPREELDGLLRRATVVVCHGGPSTIVEARRRGLVPIVLPRTSRFSEHVDDHQLRFTAAMARRGMIRLVDNELDLQAELSSAVRQPLRVPPGDVLADPAVAARRLGTLVDELVARGRRRASPAA